MAPIELDLSIEDFAEALGVPGFNIEDRHPTTQHLWQFFQADHLPVHLRIIAEHSRAVAWGMIRSLDDGPELSAGLRKLLEAKDCFVRAAL